MIFAAQIPLLPGYAAAALPLQVGREIALDDGSLGYMVHGWRTENGLPQNSINSMAQTRDGYLWLATFNGLVRFDGLRFTVYDSSNTPELKSSRIVRLFADSTGALWISSEQGDLARLDEAGFKSFSPAEFPPGSFGTACEDPSGAIWLAGLNSGGCYRYENGRFEPVHATAENGSGRFFAIASGGAGDIWAAKGAELLQLASGVLEGVPIPGEQPRRIVALAPAREGGLWVVTPRWAQKLSNDEWAPRQDNPARGNIHSFFEDARGNVWMGTSMGEVLRMNRSGKISQLDFSRALSPVSVGCIFQDAERNIWVGTDGEGLYRIKPALVQTHTQSDGLAGKVVRSGVEDKNGNVIIISHDTLDILFNGGAPSFPVNASPVRWAGAWALARDAAGDVWLGSFGGGLQRLAGDRLEGAGGGPPVITSLFADSQNALWAGNSGALWRRDSSGFAAIQIPRGVQRMDVSAVAEDSAGGVYVALNSGGGLLHSANRSDFSPEPGFENRSLSSLWADAEDNLWVGTHGAGLALLKSRASTGSSGPAAHFFGQTLTLPGTVSGVIGDGAGSLWIASNEGIFRANLKELLSLAEGRASEAAVSHFDISDGMGSAECAGGGQPTCWATRDGRVWFATVNGVSVVDPRKLPRNSAPPQVVIEEIRLDQTNRIVTPGRALAGSGMEAGEKTGGPGSAMRPIIVPAGTRLVEIRFAALAFSDPERTRYKYRLEGFDAGWTDAEARSIAHYTGLAPGSYRFEVRGCSRDGVWNERGASVALVALPFFWETAWFRVLSGAMALGVLGLLSQRRAARLERERAAQQSFSHKLIQVQEQERTRIAGELHDSLGQNLLVMRNSALLGLAEGSTDLERAEHFGLIAKTASESLEEARVIAHNLRPYQLDHLGLGAAVSMLIASIQRSSSLRVSSELGAFDGLLSPERQTHFYRVVQEAFNNVLKHSGATEARVSLQRHEASLVFSLRDNGAGFDAKELNSPSRVKTGLGLSSMAERVNFLGGSFAVESKIGQGTEVRAIIPLKTR